MIDYLDYLVPVKRQYSVPVSETQRSEAVDSGIIDHRPDFIDFESLFGTSTDYSMKRMQEPAGER